MAAARLRGKPGRLCIRKDACIKAWAVAQVALASLEAARSEAMIALADLDSLFVTAKIDAVPTEGSGDVDAISATRDEITGLIGEEDATLAALRGRLRE